MPARRTSWPSDSSPRPPPPFPPLARPSEFCRQQGSLEGIVNGMDNTEWNPTKVRRLRGLGGGCLGVAAS